MDSLKPFLGDPTPSLQGGYAQETVSAPESLGFASEAAKTNEKKSFFFSDVPCSDTFQTLDTLDSEFGACWRA